MHTSGDLHTMSSRPVARHVLPMLLLAFACNGDQPGDGDGDPSEDAVTSGDGDGDGELEELRSEAPHDENPQLEPGEAEILAAANHALSLDIYHVLRTGQAAGEGFSISAYSIDSAFGMLYAGTVDPARSEIAQTLHFELEGERQHVAHNWLDAELSSRNLPATGSDDGEGDGEDPVVLQTANGLWMLDSYADGVSSEFLDLLAIHYDAGMKLAAFNLDPELERARINGWVSERTGGLIPELFPPDSLNEYTTLVLVNALYLKAPWAEPFSDGFTQPHDFTRLDNQIVSVEMMRAPYLLDARHVATVEYQAASLPLRGHDLEIVVILPQDLSSFEDGLDPAKLTEVFDALASVPLDLRMPKLELTADFELTAELKALGMDAPFTDTTSFDAIHPLTDVIELVVHNSVIKIDEDGLEAAAAAGIGGDGDGDGDGDPPAVMVVDRPFLLAIRDRPTNTLLFFGRVLDPTE
jgi:serpin B